MGPILTDACTYCPPYTIVDQSSCRYTAVVPQGAVEMFCMSCRLRLPHRLGEPSALVSAGHMRCIKSASVPDYNRQTLWVCLLCDWQLALVGCFCTACSHLRMWSSMYDSRISTHILWTSCRQLRARTCRSGVRPLLQLLP